MMLLFIEFFLNEIPEIKVKSSSEILESDIIPVSYIVKLK